MDSAATCAASVGDEVTVLSRSKPATEVRWIQADLTDESSMKRGLDGATFDVIHHTASLPGDTGISTKLLAAISCGAVFMGANSYIGNGPNFMVKSIAEQSGVKMPSFFGFMVYSGMILIPLFIVLTLVFFSPWS